MVDNGVTATTSVMQSEQCPVCHKDKAPLQRANNTPKTLLESMGNACTSQHNRAATMTSVAWSEQCPVHHDDKVLLQRANSMRKDPHQGHGHTHHHPFIATLWDGHYDLHNVKQVMFCLHCTNRGSPHKHHEQPGGHNDHHQLVQMMPGNEQQQQAPQDMPGSLGAAAPGEGSSNKGW